MTLLSEKVSGLYLRGNEGSASVLIFGYINLNVIDGSSFFIAGLGSMLASRVGVDVDILSANKIFSYNVVHELSSVDNVRLVDPFKSHSLFDTEGWNTEHTLSREEAAFALAQMDQQGTYDRIVVRDVVTARRLVEISPDIASRLSVYVTGVAFSNAKVDSDTIEDISALMRVNVSFILQTEQMRSTLIENLPDFDAAKYIVLGPFVPDSNREFEEEYNYNSRPSRLVYAGKFFPNWLPDRIMSGFNYARIDNPTLSLDVAGDAFRVDPDNLSFASEVKYLLNNSTGILWHGGVPRDRVRELVRESDVGVSWRSGAMNFSTEFSTKVLEYGSLGKPSLLNPSPVNRQILGNDYPLYVDNMSEYIGLLRNLDNYSSAIEEAAHRCWEVADSHSYSRASERLLEFFDMVPNFGPDAVVLDDRDLGTVPYLAGSTTQNVPVFNISARSGRIVLRTVSSTAGGASLGTVNDSLSEVYFMQELRKRSADAIAFDEHQNAVSGGTGSDEHVADDSKRVAQLESQIEALKEEVRESQTTAAKAEDRLASLRASKLGKVQTWWWKKRR